MKQGSKTAKNGVSATELAQMGTCERMVWLEHHLGKRRTAAQAQAIQRGLDEHVRFFDESRQLLDAKAGQPRGRCFIATLLLANRPHAADQLAALRAYRDQVMKPTRLGRRLVLTYYRIGPRLCHILTRLPWLQHPVRLLVRVLAALAAASLERSRIHECEGQR